MADFFAKGNKAISGFGGDTTPHRIDFDVWNNYSEEQKTALKQQYKNIHIMNVPEATGYIDADLMTKLWENPSPTASFAAQNITLASDDYDFLIWLISYSTSYNYRIASVIVEKGKDVFIGADTYSGGVINYSRQATYTNDKRYAVSSGHRNDTTNDSVCVPVAIFGIKQSLSLKFQAIAHDVKASVDYSTDEHVIGTWVDGSTLYEKTVQINSTNDGVYHNLSFSSLGINPNVIFVKEHFLQGSDFTIYGNTWNASNYFYEVSRDGNNIRYINHWGSDSTHSDKVIITIRYTKTS